MIRLTLSGESVRTSVLGHAKCHYSSGPQFPLRPVFLLPGRTQGKKPPLEGRESRSAERGGFFDGDVCLQKANGLSTARPNSLGCVFLSIWGVASCVGSVFSHSGSKHAASRRPGGQFQPGTNTLRRSVSRRGRLLQMTFPPYPCTVETRILPFPQSSRNSRPKNKQPVMTTGFVPRSRLRCARPTHRGLRSCHTIK